VTPDITSSAPQKTTYDKIGQLKSAIGTGGDSTENLGYAYDTAWNLNTRTNYGTPQAFQVGVKNELTNTVGMSCCYDSNGNVTYLVNAGQISEAIYRFDPEPPTPPDLLTLRRDDKNQITTWNYDQHGRVTNKIVQASASILRYQGAVRDKSSIRMCWMAASIFSAS